ncbi:MAG: hypothetical protein DCO99_11315 [Synechococcus sp. XM-24]|nr:MAG: hypothetical protein DCO99_11315 [Synechococcus sp. XM-24]
MLKSFTLKEAVSGTVRRGDSLATKRLANLNLGADGPRALNGTIPVYTGPLADSLKDSLASNYNFELDSKVQISKDSIDGDFSPDNNTWRTFFSTNPHDQNQELPKEAPPFAPFVGNGDILPAVYLEEGLKVYKSTLGLNYILNPQSLDNEKTNVFLGVNGIGPGTTGADTETREPFLVDYGGGQVAAFTYVNLPWMAGYFADFSSPNHFFIPKGEFSEYNFDYQGTSLSTAQALAHTVFKNAVHELGHVFGLQHPGNYNGAEPKSITELIWNQDSFDESLMSYVPQDRASDLGVTGTDGVWLLNLTPRTLDFLALDSIYAKQIDSEGRPFGTSRAFNGDTRYGFASTVSEEESVVYASLDELYNYRVALTIADGSGIDTLDFSGYTKSSLIDLYVMTGDEYKTRFSQINGSLNNLSLAVGTVIENAIGGYGDDTLKGNQFNNVLIGNDGNDRFEVSSGYDVIIGGTGVDRVSIAGDERDYLIGSIDPVTTVLRSKDGASQIVLNGVEFVEFQPLDGVKQTPFIKTSVASLNAIGDLALQSFQLPFEDRQHIQNQLANIGIFPQTPFTLI